MSLPTSEDATPNVVKVTAEPAEKVSESQKAFLGSWFPVPTTYPMISGTLDNEQGVNEVNNPASKASTGATHILCEISVERISSH